MNLKVGAFVRLVVPVAMKADAFAVGRVESIDTFEDYYGVRAWYSVRWFDANGLPESSSKRHAPQEIEAA